MPYVQQITGTWSGKYAGGNPTSPTYVFNPHHHFQISREVTAGSLHATLSSGEDTAINLKLFRLPSASVTRLQQYVWLSRTQAFS